MQNRILRYFDKPQPRYQRELIWERPRSASFRRYQRVLQHRVARLQRVAFWIGLVFSTVMYVLIVEAGK